MPMSGGLILGLQSYDRTGREIDLLCETKKGEPDIVQVSGVLLLPGCRSCCIKSEFHGSACARPGLPVGGRSQRGSIEITPSRKEAGRTVLGMVPSQPYDRANGRKARGGEKGGLPRGHQLGLYPTKSQKKETRRAGHR